MAAKKGGKKKGGGKGKFFRVLLVVGLLGVTLAAAFVLLILRPFENPRRPPVKVSQSKGGKEIKDIGRPNLPPPEPPKAKVAPLPEALPMAVPEKRIGKLPPLAIIIDDMGYQTQLDEEFIRLDLGLTFAFFPHGPHTAVQAELAKKQGREVLLHFPMEPDDSHMNPGPGAITVGMSRARIGEVFAENLALVPQAVGINNHMGSRFTRDGRAMGDFMTLVRGSGLFFVDSLTSPASVGYSLAREMGVKTGRRQVFLDNVREEAQITAQLHQLLAIAERQGGAIGIGHPYPQTLAALRAASPEIRARARMVAVGQLVQ